MPDFGESLELVVKISKDNLYPKLIAQLNKDFCLSGLPEEFSTAILPEKLQAKLSEVIQNIMVHRFSDYLNILYRIDISEFKIKSLKETDPEQLSVQVAILILQRECQKVWIRNRP